MLILSVSPVLILNLGMLRVKLLIFDVSAYITFLAHIIGSKQQAVRSEQIEVGSLQLPFVDGYLCCIVLYENKIIKL